MKRRILLFVVITVFALSALFVAQPAKAASGAPTGFLSWCAGFVIFFDNTITFNAGDMDNIVVTRNDTNEVVFSSSTLVAPGTYNIYVGFFASPLPQLTPLNLSFTATGMGTYTLATNCDNGGPAFQDGRYNNNDPEQSVAVYCEGTTMVFYAIYLSKGYLAFKMTKEELAKFPTKPNRNTLLKEAKGVRLYRLTSGELQVNRALPDGKDYVFIFSGCGG